MSRFYIYFFIYIIAGNISAATAQSPDFTGLTVMINPGHGGHDSDDRGMPNGFWESESNLTKGLWLGSLLEERKCEVIMSRVENRTEDDLPLSQIAAIANQNNVDLFISIHSNASNQSSNFPLTIFNGKSDQPVNPEAKRWAIDLWEQLITIRATYWTNEDPHYIGDLTLNPDWTYGYGVLYPLQVPGIISEGSFHDYQPEMDRLLSTAYRKQESWNILYAMVSYFNLDGAEPHGIISGILRDSLLTKDNYSIAGSPDKYQNVNGAIIEVLETGDIYRVDTLNTGFYMFDSIAPGEYHLVFSARDYFNDTLEIDVLPHQFTYVNHWLEADKTMSPKLVSHSPAEGALTPCFDPVTFTFNMNMDSTTVAEAFSIHPYISGNFSWDKDYLRVSFQPYIPYDTGTTYTVTLDSIAEHQWGVHMDTIHSFSFITDKRNKYQLESSFPSEGQELVSPYLQFRLIFDAPLKNSSLINAVSIVSEDGTILNTKGANIITVDGMGHYYFSPETDLEFSTGYTLLLAGSIQDEQNIPLVDTQRISFHIMENPGLLTILDEFDDTDQWKINLTESQGIDNSSFLYPWKKSYLSGSASMLLRYNFLSDDAICIIQAIEPIVLDNKLSEAGLWIWGNMSYHQIYLGFDNEIEKKGCRLDFSGWGYYKTEIPDGATALTHLKLVRLEGETSGDLQFDAFHQPGSTLFIDPAIAEESGIRIYPNPLTGSSVYVTGLPETAFSYTLYSLTGTLIWKGENKPGDVSIELPKRLRDQQLLILNIYSEKNSYSILLNIAQ